MVEWIGRFIAALQRAGAEGGFFRERILPALREVWAFIKAFVEWAQVLWAAWGDEITAVARTAFSTLFDVLKNAFGILRGLLDTFAGLFTGDWQRMADGLKGIWTNLWEGLRAVVAGAWDILSVAFAGLWDSLKGWFSKLASDAWGWGRDVLLGFARGLESMFESVRQRVEDFVAGITARVKSALGIRSPSRVFEEIGLSLGEGLMRGLDLAARDVQRALLGLVPRIITVQTPAVAAAAVPAGPGLADLLPFDLGRLGTGSRITNVTVHLYVSGNTFLAERDVDRFITSRVGPALVRALRTAGVNP